MTSAIDSATLLELARHGSRSESTLAVTVLELRRLADRLAEALGTTLQERDYFSGLVNEQSERIAALRGEPWRPGTRKPDQSTR